MNKRLEKLPLTGENPAMFGMKRLTVYIWAGPASLLRLIFVPFGWISGKNSTSLRTRLVKRICPEFLASSKC
jgi:hypothetical protein